MNFSRPRIDDSVARTYDQKEIDYIEERDGKLFAFEFKWNIKKKVKPPSAWKEAYTASHFEVITPNNYLDWIGS